MRYLVLLVLLAACSSAPHEEDVKALQGAADKLVLDQVKIEDALDKEEAWLEAGKRRELDAYAEKHEAAPVERLQKIVTATRALEDLRGVFRRERETAARVSAVTTVGEDEDAVWYELDALRVALKADQKNEKIALDRWHKARAALGAEAFGEKPAPPK
ncbi:MAG TPA: hypothetical protein VFF73_00630 [Planctomycetota bacterium]|nr:hypothetical protein [Planctomycetota bacterium]